LLHGGPDDGRRKQSRDGCGEIPRLVWVAGRTDPRDSRVPDSVRRRQRTRANLHRRSDGRKTVRFQIEVACSRVQGDSRVPVMQPLTFSQRLMLYLYSANNIAGCLLAMGGLALFFTGVIDAYWWAIVAGLYGAGSLGWPRSELAEKA